MFIYTQFLLALKTTISPQNTNEYSPANIYLFKVNLLPVQLYSTLTIKTPERQNGKTF